MAKIRQAGNGKGTQAVFIIAVSTVFHLFALQAKHFAQYIRPQVGISMDRVGNLE